MKESDYIISIDKEALADLPVLTYPAAITLVDSAAEAHAALRALSKEKYVGFDTETRPSFRKGCVHKWLSCRFQLPSGASFSASTK